MDPISALSLAASVISVIQFSKEVVGICTELVKNGSVAQYRASEDSAVNLGSYRPLDPSNPNGNNLTQQNLPLLPCVHP